jgi:hypothetical protein
MEQSDIKNVIFILALTMFFAGPGLAQNDCKVLLDEISGEYDGGCKKGLADGQGTAKGTDTYTGDFKKGLPHGTGTYTWENGDVYVGDFKKGLKDGAGKQTVDLGGGQKKEQTGYWSKDKYIGQSKTPYEVVSRSPEVLSVRISETENPADDGNALFIEIQHRGRLQQSPGFGVNVTTGSFANRFPVGNKTKILVSNFPFGFTLNYMGETVELQFYMETSWNVTIDYNK